MGDCGKCIKPFTKSGPKANKVVCTECKKPFHGKCCDMTPDDYQYYVDNDLIWRCEPCSQTRRKSMALESSPKTSITYDDIYNLVKDVRKDIKEVETNLGKSIEHNFEELKETKELVHKQHEEIAALVELVNKLSTENSSLRSRLSMLEARMDDIEQYSRRDTIEIHGIPVVRNEKVVDVVKSVGKALDFPVEEVMISACHRLRSREGSGKPPGIIVKMTRRMDAEAILQKRRVKRNLSTHHIGLTESPAVPIWINESLCPGRRRLLNAAREVKTQKQYTYLWIRGGKILMRRSDGDPVKVVSTHADLDKL